jgi:general secretion pathway protein B
MDELTAKGMVLPELHVDLHVYATTPANRFVFINKQKYLEGQSLREGLVVTQITPDGVELDNGTARFLLPRQ